MSKMTKLVFKEPLVNLIVGGILVIVSVLGMFVFDWFRDFVNIFAAVIIVYYSVVRFLKEYKKHKNQHALMILSVELVIALVLSVLLVLREIDIYLGIGLVLYLRGFVYLLISQLLKRSTTFVNFLISVGVLTLGAYFYFGRPRIDDIVEWGLFILLTAYGILLIVFGVKYIKK